MIVEALAMKNQPTHGVPIVGWKYNYLRYAE